MSGFWRSKRLIYRALEKEDDDGILKKLGTDAEGLANASPFVHRPQGKKDTEAFHGFLDKALLCCAICIAPEESNATTSTTSSTAKSEPAQPTPIGILCLQGAEEGQSHHRRTEMGINIFKDYQNKGYGTEALYWGLDWGFSYANLHRIELNAYGSNERAIKLYERMGFTVEGRRRDYMFIHGRYWDAVCFGMLEDEWSRMRGEKLGIEEKV